MSILDSAPDRLQAMMFLNLARRQLIRLETEVSLALAGQRTPGQELTLLEIERQIAQAAIALTRVEALMRTLP